MEAREHFQAAVRVHADGRVRIKHAGAVAVVEARAKFRQGRPLRPRPVGESVQVPQLGVGAERDELLPVLSVCHGEVGGVALGEHLDRVGPGERGQQEADDQGTHGEEREGRGEEGRGREVGSGADGGLGSRGKFWWRWSEGRVGNRIAVGGQGGLAEAIKRWWAERISGKE